MNPIHADYIKRPPHNDFDQLFRITDSLDPKKRDDAMLYTFMQFVKMERTPDAGPHDRIGDTLTDYANYNRFKQECRKLPENLSEAFVINGIVFFTLSYCYSRADMDKDACVAANRGVVERAKSVLAEATDEADRNSCLEVIEKTQLRIDKIDDEIREAKELYAYICYNLAKPLIDAWDERRRQFIPDA